MNIKSGYFSKEAILALAMGITVSMTHVAATPTNRISSAGLIENSPDVRKDLSTSEKSKLRASIKTALGRLAELNKTLFDCCKAIQTQHVPKMAIDTEPFTVVTSNLRELESALADKWAEFFAIPVIGDEAKSLRKALAVARSRAAQNAMLLQQMKLGHTLSDSNVDMDSLRDLATHTTGKISEMVG